MLVTSLTQAIHAGSSATIHLSAADAWGESILPLAQHLTCCSVTLTRQDSTLSLSVLREVGESSIKLSASPRVCFLIPFEFLQKLSSCRKWGSLNQSSTRFEQEKSSTSLEAERNNYTQVVNPMPEILFFQGITKGLKSLKTMGNSVHHFWPSPVPVPKSYQCYSGGTIIYTCLPSQILFPLSPSSSAKEEN